MSRPNLVRCRAAQARLMPETCAVKRRILSADSAGGQTASWSTLLNTVCSIGATGREPQEQEIARRATATQAYTISLPALTDVRETDRIETGGRTFEVLGVIRDSYETARRCVCSEVR